MPQFSAISLTMQMRAAATLRWHRTAPQHASDCSLAAIPRPILTRPLEWGRLNCSKTVAPTSIYLRELIRWPDSATTVRSTETAGRTTICPHRHRRRLFRRFVAVGRVRDPTNSTTHGADDVIHIVRVRAHQWRQARQYWALAHHWS